MAGHKNREENQRKWREKNALMTTGGGTGDPVPFVDYVPVPKGLQGCGSMKTVRGIYRAMEYVAGGMSETKSCSAAGIDVRTYRDAMRRPSFKRKFDAMVDRFSPVIESAAIEAATGAEVWEEHLDRDGNVHTLRKKMAPDGVMLKFLLKNIRKDKYSDEKTINHNHLLADAFERSKGLPEKETRNFVDVEAVIDGEIEPFKPEDTQDGGT